MQERSMWMSGGRKLPSAMPDYESVPDAVFGVASSTPSLLICSVYHVRETILFARILNPHLPISCKY
jgi:hypothetical protein